ncbi:MAG: hypothetical protein AAFU54_25355 [Chloroflexota bacterium]
MFLTNDTSLITRRAQIQVDVNADGTAALRILTSFEEDSAVDIVDSGELPGPEMPPFNALQERTLQVLLVAKPALNAILQQQISEQPDKNPADIAAFRETVPDDEDEVLSPFRYINNYTTTQWTVHSKQL